MATPEQQRQAQTTVYLRPGPRGRTPVYATAGSAGCDLYASAPITSYPGRHGFCPRSGHGSRAGVSRLRSAAQRTVS